MRTTPLRAAIAALAIAAAAMAGCAGVPDDAPPYCVVWENGKPVILFTPTRAQTRAFERNYDPGALFPKQAASASKPAR